MCVYMVFVCVCGVCINVCVMCVLSGEFRAFHSSLYILCVKLWLFLKVVDMIKV